MNRLDYQLGYMDKEAGFMDTVNDKKDEIFGKDRNIVKQIAGAAAGGVGGLAAGSSMMFPASRRGTEHILGKFLKETKGNYGAGWAKGYNKMGLKMNVVMMLALAGTGLAAALGAKFGSRWGAGNKGTLPEGIEGIRNSLSRTLATKE